MSVFRDHEIPCPGCGQVERRKVAESINAVNRTDLRQQILDDAFQRFTCTGCGARVVVDGPMLYLDFDRGQWLELFPAPDEAAWQAREAETLRRFRQTAVELAPPLIRERAGELTVRTVFGVDALREKLVAFDAGIDDRALEAAKLGALGREPDLASRTGLRIRLRTVTAGELRCAIHDGRQPVGQLTLPRVVLDDAAGDAWRATRDRLAGSYVDVARLLAQPA